MILSTSTLFTGMGPRGLRADGKPQHPFSAKLETPGGPARGTGCCIHLRRPGGKFVPPLISAIVCATRDAVELLYDTSTTTSVSLAKKVARNPSVCNRLYIYTCAWRGYRDSVQYRAHIVHMSSMWNRCLSLFFLYVLMFWCCSACECS